MPAAANSQSAAAAAAVTAATQNQPPLAESDSDSEDQLPTAADGSLLVSEPPQPLYVIICHSLCMSYLSAFVCTFAVMLPHFFAYSCFWWFS